MKESIQKRKSKDSLALTIQATRKAERAARQATDARLAVLRSSIGLWSDASTGSTVRRREEMLAKKRRVVESFFRDIEKDPCDTSPEDIRTWCEGLKLLGRRPTTIYTRVSFLSSFYDWAQKAPELSNSVRTNPVVLGRPKAPKPYQTESSKAWTDEELQSIVDVVGKRAASGDIVGKRDLAILLLYTSTGWRREEVMSLKGKDVRVLDDRLIIGGVAKGGRYRARELRDPEVHAALLDYLESAGRMWVLKGDNPLWTRHDDKRRSGDGLGSHAFVKNLKCYAKKAGVEHVHLHQTRHTFARIVAEETGSFLETQDALDHQNLHTTTVYVQRIAVKRDLHSGAVSRRRKRSGSAKSAGDS
jgi:site-specific recombinase XerD